MPVLGGGRLNNFPTAGDGSQTIYQQIRFDLLITSRKPKCRGGKDLGFLENGIKNKNQGSSKTRRQIHRDGKERLR